MTVVSWRWRDYHRMEMAMATLFATPLPSPVSNNKIYSPMAEWTFSWCRSGRACDALIWGTFTSTRCISISYYRWEHNVVVGSMIIFRFRVTFTGCIEVCNEGIKCFIAALLFNGDGSTHDRLSKRIGIILNIMEPFSIMSFAWILGVHQQPDRTWCSDDDVGCCSRGTQRTPVL